MIKGRPCKCVEVSTSKTGKHGHAKAHIVALDIFTGKKMEDLCPTSHNLDVPFVKRTEFQVLSADPDSGEVSLLQEDGNTKDDLNLPTFVQVGEPTDDDKKVTEEMLKALAAWRRSSRSRRPAETVSHEARSVPGVVFWKFRRARPLCAPRLPLYRRSWWFLRGTGP